MIKIVLAGILLGIGLSSDDAWVIDMLRCYFSNYTTGVIAATGEVFKIGSKILDRKTETLLLKKGFPEH